MRSYKTQTSSIYELNQITVDAVDGSDVGGDERDGKDYGVCQEQDQHG